MFARFDVLVRDLGPDGERHSKLIDLSDTKVANPATVDLMRRIIAAPARKPVYAQRVAYFGASPLVARQVQRLCELRPGLALFTDRDSAYAWLRMGLNEKAPPTSRSAAPYGLR